MLDSLINRRTSVEVESIPNNNGESVSADTEPMLNVSRAEIIFSQQQVIKCSSKDENKHLYSLGIVLYQLFSGETIVPEKKEILNKLVKYAQLKLKEAYEKLSESERVRYIFVCVFYTCSCCLGYI